MRRFLAQWLVSCSLDAGREPPRWLRAWLAGDAESARFEAAARHLASSLQTDAVAWRSLAPQVGRPPQSQAANGSWQFRWLTASVLTGCLAVVGALWLTTEKPAEQAARTTSPADAALFVAAIEEGWLATEAILPFDEPLALWPPLEPAFHRPPAAALGEATGQLTRRTVKAVDAEVRRQRNALDTQVTATLSFFAYRLPNSAAKVVGLPLGQEQGALN